MDFDIPDWGGSGGFSYHMDVPTFPNLNSSLSTQKSAGVKKKGKGKLQKQIENLHNPSLIKKRKSTEADLHPKSKKKKKENVKDNLRTDEKSNIPSSDKSGPSHSVENNHLKKNNRNKYKELHVRQTKEKNMHLQNEGANGSSNENKLAKPNNGKALLVNGVTSSEGDSPPKKKKKRKNKAQTEIITGNEEISAKGSIKSKKKKFEYSTNTLEISRQSVEVESQEVQTEKRKKKKKKPNTVNLYKGNVIGKDAETDDKTLINGNTSTQKKKKKKKLENNINIVKDKVQNKDANRQDAFTEKKKKKKKKSGNTPSSGEDSLQIEESTLQNKDADRQDASSEKKKKKKMKNNLGNRTIAVKDSLQLEESARQNIEKKQKKKLHKNTDQVDMKIESNTVTKNNFKTVDSGQKITKSVNKEGKLINKKQKNKENSKKVSIEAVSKSKKSKSRKKLSAKEEEEEEEEEESDIDEALVFDSDEEDCDPKLLSDLDIMIKKMKLNRFHDDETSKHSKNKKQGKVLMENAETDDDNDIEWEDDEAETGDWEDNEEEVKTVSSVSDKTANTQKISLDKAAHKKDSGEKQNTKGGATEVDKSIQPVKEKARFDKKKLSRLLDEAKMPMKTPEPVVETLKEKMEKILAAAKFRFINEQLYTTTSQEAQKLFKSDPQSFSTYHQGYQDQVKSWPISPLNLIVDWLCTKPKDWVVADLGCGEALLSLRVPQTTVHSFDLVAANSRVTACDMTNTPLASSCVNVVVFCLSLMGTNVADFIVEANRILKDGGIMKIAEVESRFADTNSFISEVKQFGFNSINKDVSHPFFHLFEFKKYRKIKNKHILPQINLKACVYKKR